MELKATPKSIDDVLRLQRKYVIPRFQREFSWELEELSEIYDDLIDNIKYINDKLCTNEYFIGSLVLVGDDDDTENIERYVVDGQQRLTTFTIAFAVLSQKLKEMKEEKLSQITHLNVLGEDNDGNPYAKLVNENPKPFFQRRIQQKDIDFLAIPKSTEEKRLLYAYNFFDRQLKESILLKEIRERNPEMGQINYIDALKAFRDQILKCKVIYVTVKSFDDAYTIFEVLNAKGKDLSSIDIIKNSIFSILTEKEPLDIASEKWSEMKSKIKKCDNTDFNTFYRHYWLSKYCLSTSRKLVANFEKYVPRTIDSYTALVDDMANAANDYSEIVAPDINKWLQPEDLSIYTTLNALGTFNTTQVRIFLLALFDAKRRNVISHKSYKRILTYLEYYHFVFTAVCSSRPSGLERRYSSYARKLRACTRKDESTDCINNLIDDLKTSLPEYNIFESHFKSILYTSKQERDKKLVQYILKKLEVFYATDELKPNSFTIEHILPESTGNNYVGMVGNLIPLGEKLNSELKDKNFKIKLAKYENSQYATVKKFIKEYKEKENWTEELIEKRTIEIAQILYKNIIEG
ncbi:DUF262 domain-containing protein [uncultured Phascolarctobacterium sp.]|uniref:DUF262 domain-containing protein n=1 Tax=uncultured Phascolarctobacterium sp. TaxID=512296 RepID=UPI002619B052|nr:DUF262 domain-containing HNH endonuclease family protein [uncultured Phascolarctobacterium sp.]